MVKNLIFCKSFENLNFYRKSMPQLHDFKSTRLRKYYSLNLKKKLHTKYSNKLFSTSIRKITLSKSRNYQKVIYPTTD